MPKLSPVVIGISWPTKNVAGTLSRVVTNGVDKILESSSVSNALMTTEYNMSLSTPLKPANPPSEPASELSKLACSIVSNPSCAPAAKAATPKILGDEREKFDDKRGTLLPFNPANAN